MLSQFRAEKLDAAFLDADFAAWYLHEHSMLGLRLVTEIDGTECSIAFSTKLPKTLRFMDFRAGGQQDWRTLDLGSQSAYPTITGAIFEFGFSDAILQMWAAFLDELVHGREGMRQPFYCATPEEVAWTHRLFTAALRSHTEHAVVSVTATMSSRR